MFPRSRRAVTFFIAALLVVAGQDPRLILCVGSDGHVSIERPASDCCLDEVASPSRGSAYWSAADCAGPCVDSPLRIEAAMKRTAHLDSPAACTTILAFDAWKTGADSCAFDPNPLDDPPVPASPRSRQTVFLC